MKKSTFNFIIDILMLIVMSAVVGIGFIVKYILIPGHARWDVYGENVELYMLGMDRHQWGNIHLILGFILIGLLALHIIFHWKLIVGLYQRIFKSKIIYKILTAIFLLVCALFMLAPFFTTPEVIRINQGEGRHAMHHDIDEELDSADADMVDADKPEPDKKETINEHKEQRKHKNSKSKLEIKGYMTLGEISKEHNVPLEYLKTKLNIPLSTPDSERLSQIRKKYNIEMNEIRDIVDDYK